MMLIRRWLPSPARSTNDKSNLRCNFIIYKWNVCDVDDVDDFNYFFSEANKMDVYGVLRAECVCFSGFW